MVHSAKHHQYIS